MRKFFALLLATLSTTLFAGELDLSGTWEVRLLPNPNATKKVPEQKAGPTQNVMYHLTFPNETSVLQGKIKLPGTLDEGSFGNKVTKPNVGCLTRKVEFIGTAEYTRTIDIPESLANKELALFLERVMWKSELFVDSQRIGSFDSLSTPHIYNLTLPAGKHTFLLRIDNSMQWQVGEKSHAYGEHMQTIWNGVIGKMTLAPVSKIATQNPYFKVNTPAPASVIEVVYPAQSPVVETATVFDPIGKKELTLKAETKAGKAADGTPLQIACFNIAQAPENFRATWDEFKPYLYTLTLFDAQKSKLYTQKIGFRSIQHKGNNYFLNGNPVFLRGNLDNCHFPLTGYPSTKTEDWRHILKVCKDRGINMVRFHSYCPPEAAFDAADELGIYLAPEAGIWLDGWMPGNYAGIGNGPSPMKEDFAEKFVFAEAQRIVGTYGNHPSFLFFCIGNELGSSNFEVLGSFGKRLKDAEKILTPSDNGGRYLFSASTARAITPADDYMVTHHYPGVGAVRQRMNPHTNWSYEDVYSRTKIPTVAHEIGQWPVYPLWDEIKKYTGVLTASNLIALRENAKSGGLLRYNKMFHDVSGQQCKMMYKDEIESFLRTPSCRGIHLLGMQDYSGQGEALVGWLNSFYEDKKVFPVEEIRGCFAPIVTLAAFKTYTYQVNQSYNARLSARNMTFEPLKNVCIAWKISDAAGKVINSGSTPEKAVFAPGELADFGTIDIPLKTFAPCQKYTLQTVLVSSDKKAVCAPNTWPFWVFDEKIDMSVPENAKESMVVTSDYSEAVRAVQAGKNVLFFCAKAGKNNVTRQSKWGSVYWSTTWFPGQQPKTLGLYLDEKHPIFKNFPCEGFGDWLWYRICKSGKIFVRQNHRGPGFTPVAMPIPDFHNNARLSTIFEAQIGESHIVFCGYDLERDFPECKQLKRALIQYVAGGKFASATNLKLDALVPYFGDAPKAESQAERSIMKIQCAKKLKNSATAQKWDAKQDDAVCKKGVGYRCENVSASHHNNVAFWEVSDASKVSINTNGGELGTLRVMFVTPDKPITGTLLFEGRKYQIPAANTENFFMDLNIDREDTLDGVLTLEFKLDGKPLKIREIDYLPPKSE